MTSMILKLQQHEPESVHVCKNPLRRLHFFIPDSGPLSGSKRIPSFPAPRVSAKGLGTMLWNKGIPFRALPQSQNLSAGQQMADLLLLALQQVN